MKKALNALELTSIIACLSFLLYSGLANGQGSEANRRYRVIAYKSGNSGIWSMSNETVVTPTMTLYVPNTFTPNGDGLNDTFGVYGQSVREFSMQVFDRWGEKVFESADPNQTWDGTYHGQMSPQGTYVYKIYAQGPDGRKSAKNGVVNLIQ